MDEPQILKTSKHPPIKDTNQLLNVLFDQSNIMIAHLDPQFNFIRVSQAYADADGRIPEFFPGKNHFSLYPNEENKRIFIETVEKGEPYYVKAKDFIYEEHPERGESAWDWSLIPIKDELGITTSLVLTLYNVTMKKKAEKAEKALLKERSFTEVALNAQIDIFFVFEPSTGKAIRWNKAFNEISGYSDEEISQLKAPESYYSLEELDRFKESTKKIQKGETTVTEAQFITKDGALIPFEYVASGIFDEENKLKYIVTIGRNIIERKESELKLRSERDKLQKIIEGLTSAEIGIDIIDLKYKIIFQNSFLKERFGDILGECCHVKYMNLEQPCEFCPMIKAIKNNRVEHVELSGADGRDYEIISAPLINLDGTIDKAIEVVMDITDRKKAEKKIRESEEKYRYLFEKSSNAIVLLDITGKIIDCNYASVRMFGYSLQELIGQNYLELPVYSENIISTLKKRFQIIAKKGDLEPLETEIKKKDGSIATTKASISYITIAEQDYFQAIIEDITERKEAEKLILEENKKLMEFNQMKQELLTRFSHELNTPITSIFGASQTMLELYREIIPEEMMDFVKMIHRGGMRLKNLTDNLIDALNIDSENLQLQMENHDLIYYINDYINNLKYFAHNRQILLLSTLPSKLFLNLDIRRFKQAFTNIVLNAINNTPSGGTVSINIFDAQELIEIEIKDTGIGLTEKEKGRLFEKFGKIERFGKGYDIYTEGPGLGLFISKQIIEAHGGQILVSSKGRNQGSLFTIRLPKKEIL
ncbi:MAG: PAS domain S-box protein [Promethearchaeota archaeon]